MTLLRPWQWPSRITERLRRQALWAYAAAFAIVNVLIFCLPGAQAQSAGGATATGKPSQTLKILALGDSLTAGYNLPNGQSVPDHLARLLASSPVIRDNHLTVAMTNGGLSGDTSAGGLARLDWMLTDRPDLVIIELGANDALRGLSPDDTRLNLIAIIQTLQDAKIGILLTGMLAPPNVYSKDDMTEFNGIYPELAAEFGVQLYPFFLEGVAGNPALLQKDGMHPTEKGTEEIARRLLPDVEKAVQDVIDQRGKS